MKFGRAFWKFYQDNLIFNIPSALIFGMFFGILWGVLIFSSFGFLIGVIGYHYFYKEHYYFYYNIGWTRKKLMQQVFIVNFLIATFLISIILITNG